MLDIMDYQKKLYSQRGEDGVIECVLRELKISTGWCCEFGAWDGIHLSNVYNLISQGWAGVLIESDPVKFSELSWNMRKFKSVYCFNNCVTLEPDTNLNAILSGCPIPCDFDVLSIDIDSYDYWVWASVVYNPKLVIIEYNPNWDTKITVPYRNPPERYEWDQYFGASATALENLGCHKGYDLIGVIPHNNLIFLRKGLNRDLFKTVDLSSGFYLDKKHRPLTCEQTQSLIHDPSLGWGL